MKASDLVNCLGFPCDDVRHDSYVVPGIDLDPRTVTLVMVSEVAPSDPGDYYYAAGTTLFQQTTVQAFRDAGHNVSSVKDLISLGVYLTTAVKCGKTGYGVNPKTVATCSLLLEKELSLFPNTRAYLMMGDVAIKAFNAMARRAGRPRVIPAGSTYKLRGQEYYFQQRRAFPSYLQAGPSFFIEKSKRRMIAEDIKRAMELI